jgi:hypothetical protein
MFKVDLYKLIVWMTPVWLRTDNVIILAKAWVSPLVDVYNQFVIFRTAKLYRLQYNCQVCFYQKVLNDQFDALQRRIQIIDFDGHDRIYFWSDAAKQDVYFGTQNFWPDASYLDSGIDYTVQIPADVATTNSDYQHLIGLINEYKFASKGYNIVRI